MARSRETDQIEQGSEVSTAPRHTPVMLDRCVELLAPALAHTGAVAIDGTLGMGGHTEAILARCPQAMVVGIDRDPQALALATERLASFRDRFRAHHAEYDDIAGALAVAGADAATRILLDLGVSSLQIDEAERGFSYAQDAPLDMRMNPEDPVSAADLLRDADEAETHARAARTTARSASRHASRKRSCAAVQPRRSRAAANSSTLCERAFPRRLARRAPTRQSAPSRHCASRSNRELEVLERTMPRAIEATAVGGRIVVMSYHSLEDRIVKRAFAAGSEVSAPVGLPVVPEDDKPYLKLVTRGAEQASVAEAEANPRSKPVRLRAVERIRPRSSSEEGSMSAAPVRHPRPIAPGSRPAVRTLLPPLSQASGARVPSRSVGQRERPSRSRGHLRAVQRQSRHALWCRSRGPARSIIIGALSTVLLVNTSMARGAYERRDLKIEIANLHEQRSTLVTQARGEVGPRPPRRRRARAWNAARRPLWVPILGGQHRHRVGSK